MNCVGLIEALGKEYGTLGNVLAACAVMLSRPDSREGLTKAPPLSKPDRGYFDSYPLRDYIRRGINQHTLEKICARRPVRATKLAQCLKVLEEREL